ncbi:hypothetical protein [Pararhizobium sp. DWP3-4]|uniref:hypothetical protein n=1 Tax=unclassified Pararhizobium TaxID=2643050 RepID=UPI003CEC56F2
MFDALKIAYRPKLEADLKRLFYRNAMLRLFERAAIRVRGGRAYEKTAGGDLNEVNASQAARRRRLRLQTKPAQCCRRYS